MKTGLRRKLGSDLMRRQAPTRIGKCSCGHMQTLHCERTGYADRPNRIAAYGHGYCVSHNCQCPQFSWVAWWPEDAGGR